ncbi:hypothetical protein RND71_002132 [Anisodus tanguticus]|uniref:RING-type E3 ubiquitin transferase n=1 Tax=Anisodus tanguticus TaxID=243964 RepID=A0AAE1T2H6_9SOLA|nr:hypothetical protein RND71_002132 [Anisodus tanguticus]
MSTEAITLSTASSLRSYRCYNCNDAFHITITANTTTVSSSSSSFRCPRCFHRHFLPNYTIATVTPPPSQPSISNFTPPSGPTTNFLYFYESDSETDESDSDDFSFDLFNSNEYQFRTPTLKSFIDSLPIVKINESKSCSICMEEFIIDSKASQLPCKHYFHNHCIVPWLNRNNTCPLCRHKLPQEDKDDIEKDLEPVLGTSTGLISEFDEGEEFQDYSVVFASTTPGRTDLEEMRDEDGDMLMVDA